MRLLRRMVPAAVRLRRVCREGKYAARLGGDEFCLLLHGVTEQDLTNLAQRVAGTMSRPYEMGEHNLNCPASVGAAGPDDSQEHPAEAAPAGGCAILSAQLAAERGAACT